MKIAKCKMGRAGREDELRVFEKQKLRVGEIYWIVLFVIVKV